MKNFQLIAAVFAVILAADYCSASGLLGALGLLNPYGCGYGYGYGCAPPMPPPSLGLAQKLALSKIASMGMGCHSGCCMSHAKPCILTKLLLLKKKLLEKKMLMSLKKHQHCGCCCGSCK